MTRMATKRVSEQERLKRALKRQIAAKLAVAKQTRKQAA